MMRIRVTVDIPDAARRGLVRTHNAEATVRGLATRADTKGWLSSAIEGWLEDMAWDGRHDDMGTP